MINKWLSRAISVRFPESNWLIIIGYLYVLTASSAQASSWPYFRLRARWRSCTLQLSHFQAQTLPCQFPVHLWSRANPQLDQHQRPGWVLQPWCGNTTKLLLECLAAAERRHRPSNRGPRQMRAKTQWRFALARGSATAWCFLSMWVVI